MNPSSLLTPGSDDELNWLAFRYVAGELTGEEAASFETRLANDLSVCEAVAAVSELTISTQATLLSERLETARRTEDPRPWTARVRSWVAVGSTVLALGWLFLLLGDGSDRAARKTADSPTRNQSQSAADLIAHWSRYGETEFSDEFPEIAPTELTEPDDPDIPGWMIAAVSLENAETPADEMPDTNRVELKEN